MISVIMSVYNDEEFLSSSIDSILNQSLKEFEFIIIDDCSSDQSKLIIDQFAQRDKRIKCYHNDTNIGLTKSLNRAINISKGDFIARQDGDDVSAPNRLKKQIEFITKNDFDLVGTKINYIDSNGKILATSENKYDIINSLKTGNNPICHGSIMMKKSILERVHNYNEFYKNSQDFDLYLRILEQGGHIGLLNEPLYSFRITRSSVSSNKTSAYQSRIFSNFIRRKNGDPEDYSPIVLEKDVIKNSYEKRMATLLFFSDNQREFRKYLFKNIFNLDNKLKFIGLLLFSLFPKKIQFELRKIFKS